MAVVVMLFLMDQTVKWAVFFRTLLISFYGVVLPFYIILRLYISGFSLCMIGRNHIFYVFHCSMNNI